ncbi:MAG TPA: nucleotidyltransferase domain-containing protein [Afifellaceae bacterium]|nr:nucleotidyltransferase domain-containing protein [Afifellaceae bacterium]
MRSTEDVLRPPTEAEVAEALKRFAADLRRHYGDRLKGLYLFGSRARGDHEPFSDADVAVVLADEDWGFVREVRQLARLAVDTLIETGVEVQGWPVSQAAWDHPENDPESALINAMRRHAKLIEAHSEPVLE